ncbi:MAG: hypothetical protein ACE3JK_02500 [Sporolactobacillus sp.]
MKIIGLGVCLPMNLAELKQFCRSSWALLPILLPSLIEQTDTSWGKTTSFLIKKGNCQGKDSHVENGHSALAIFRQ